MSAEPTHPLNVADAARSEARIADIELGLTDPRDGSYWRDKLEARIMMLEDDDAVFGLVPHETSELERLKAIRSKLEIGSKRPTEAEIDAAMTPGGGWTKETLAGWGVAWPPPKGWKAALLAKESNDA